MRVLEAESAEVVDGVKRLNGAKVRFPQTPLDIELHFGIHGNGNLVGEELAGAIKAADVLILETIGWTPQGMIMRQEIADGSPAALNDMKARLPRLGSQGRFIRSLCQAMFDTGVQVHCPDVPARHSLHVQYLNTSELHNSLAFAVQNNFVDADQLPMKELVDACQPFFEVNAKREKYMLEHFFPKALLEAERLKMVGFFGLMHSGIAPVLARQAAKAGRDDISVAVNEFGDHQPEADAHRQFTQQQPMSRQSLIDYLKSIDFS